MWKPEETCGICGICERSSMTPAPCSGDSVCACVSVCTQAQVLVDMHGVCISDPGHSCNVGVSGVGWSMHAHVRVMGLCGSVYQ